MTKYRILHIPTGAFCDITDKEFDAVPLDSVILKCVVSACNKTHCSLSSLCKDCSWHTILINAKFKLGFSEIEYFIEEIE